MMLALLVGCEPGSGFCTELDCEGLLTFEVSGPSALTDLVGTVTANHRTVDVACPGAADEDVWCYDDFVSVFNGSLTFGTELTAGSVDWDFTTGASGGDAFHGSGTVVPEWTPQYPNGERCGGACTNGLAHVTLARR
jgi:hypothetical protein